MKTRSLASQSGRSTKGGRLPRKCGPLPFWTLVLPFRRESGVRSTTEAPPSQHNGAIPDSNVSAFLQQAVFQRFCGERGLNHNPNLRAEVQVQSAPSSKLMADRVLPGDGPESGVNDGESNAAGMALDTRLPRWKRIADLGILTCTVWIWLPLTTLVMCVVKIASPGSAIYRQSRVGYRGKEFMIFKFRSMHVNAETKTHEEYLEQLMLKDFPMTKLDASDPRLIPCGRFLRATGLDELAQIFNVIRGDMSLVGPRPCTVVEFQRYRAEDRDRVNAPPGITGFWQVNGKNRTTFNEMIAMDIFYTKNMALSLDLAIIWKTIPAIVRQALESAAATRAERRKAAPQSVGLTTSNLESSPGHT